MKHFIDTLYGAWAEVWAWHLMLRWAALFLDSSLQMAKDDLPDNVDMPSILPEFLTICVRSALRCRDGCLTGALGDDMCYSRTVHCMATRRYQMAPAVDARCQDFYWGSSELTSYKDRDLRQKLECSLFNKRAGNIMPEEFKIMSADGSTCYPKTKYFQKCMTSRTHWSGHHMTI